VNQAYQIIRDSIRRVLAQKADGEFLVAGYQKRGKGADQVVSKSRLVEVYYNRGDFPKSGGSQGGPNKHNCTFRIDMTAAEPAKGDKATINDPNATAAEVAQALERMKASDLLADKSIDELFGHVYRILMAADNQDFDLPVGFVASRWVDQFNKDEPIERGKLTILTASCLLTCSTSEDVEGYTGVQAGDIVDVTVQLETDIPGKAGTETGA